MKKKYRILINVIIPSAIFIFFVIALCKPEKFTFRNHRINPTEFKQNPNVVIKEPNYNVRTIMPYKSGHLQAVKIDLLIETLRNDTAYCDFNEIQKEINHFFYTDSSITSTMCTPLFLEKTASVTDHLRALISAMIIEKEIQAIKEAKIKYGYIFKEQ